MLLLFALADAAPPAPTLCAPGEKTALSCSDSGKIYSICTSPDFGKGSGWIEYRFGKPGAIELVYPKTRENSHQAFDYSLTAIHGRASGWLKFDNGGYTYEIQYLAQYNEPSFSSLSLLVSRNGERVATFGCAPSIDHFEDLSASF